MGPDTAYQDLVRALDAGDIDTARNAFGELDHWLSEGGFPPAVWRPLAEDTAAREVTREKSPMS